MPRKNLKTVRNFFAHPGASSVVYSLYTFTEPMTFDRIILSGCVRLSGYDVAIDGYNVCGLSLLRLGTTTPTVSATNLALPYPMEQDILWTWASTQTDLNEPQILPLMVGPVNDLEIFRNF